MDIVNTKIGQAFARDAATSINEKSFVNSNLVGFKTGASIHSAGENPVAMQQVKFVDKSVAELPQKQAIEKKLKENLGSADTNAREENIDISEAIGGVSEFLRTTGTELAFSVDSDTSKQVVTVRDKQSGDVIRQIPSEEVLDFAARVQELAADPTNTVGIIINGRA
ncbi:flagellar protein FlaG [Agaribacter marinus]|uniref:Flagellar protein FlaG n=1 Tax=Agaribacter marinus TaxID=1431249 RepID=A0AA37SW62_9ALTE|nr:flagellar protein FlaG [Agaribacter marinus]GLR70783.1 flagellar protein FlaG [Agaribacter marinus]